AGVGASCEAFKRNCDERGVAFNCRVPIASGMTPVLTMEREAEYCAGVLRTPCRTVAAAPLTISNSRTLQSGSSAAGSVRSEVGLLRAFFVNANLKDPFLSVVNPAMLVAVVSSPINATNWYAVSG